MTHEVVFSPEAASDLDTLYDYIGDSSGPDRAAGFVMRIVEYLASFDKFPERAKSVTTYGRDYG